MGWLYGSRAEMRASRGMLGRSGLISKPHDGLHASCRSRLMLAAVERTSRRALLLRRTSLSRGLRTQPLPATLAPVGYRRGNNESHYPFRAETITYALPAMVKPPDQCTGRPQLIILPAPVFDSSAAAKAAHKSHLALKTHPKTVVATLLTFLRTMSRIGETTYFRALIDGQF
jgi:hypothetical protein